MKQYIKKSALVSELKRRLHFDNNWIEGDKRRQTHTNGVSSAYYRMLGSKNACESFLDFIDTLEVKEVDTWHLQEKEYIYDAVKGWGLQTFVCVMKDGSIQKFTGNLDEDCDGHINVHIDGVNDDYDNVDDIVKWIELT